MNILECCVQCFDILRYLASSCLDQCLSFHIKSSKGTEMLWTTCLPLYSHMVLCDSNPSRVEPCRAVNACSTVPLRSSAPGLSVLALLVALLYQTVWNKWEAIRVAGSAWTSLVSCSSPLQDAELSVSQETWSMLQKQKSELTSSQKPDQQGCPVYYTPEVPGWWGVFCFKLVQSASPFPVWKFGYCSNWKVCLVCRQEAWTGTEGNPDPKIMLPPIFATIPRQLTELTTFWMFGSQMGVSEEKGPGNLKDSLGGVQSASTRIAGR